MHAQPPGPGFPLQAPSVKIVTSGLEFVEMMMLLDIFRKNNRRGRLFFYDSPVLAQ